MKEKSAAVLTFHDAENYSDDGAKNIAKWLRRQATYIQKKEFRANVSKRYTARYLYIEEE